MEKPIDSKPVWNDTSNFESDDSEITARSYHAKAVYNVSDVFHFI